MKMTQYGKVAVIMGGSSSEREISLMSGMGVLEALQEKGVDAHKFDPAQHPIMELKHQGFERAFIILHGPFGEDGTLQGALETLGIPYTGSRVAACALGMDKWRTNLLWRATGLPVPDFVLLDETTDFANIESTLGLPCFIKPAREGSSIGITKAKTLADLKPAWQLARKYDDIVIAERFLGGGEYTCALLGNRALPTIKIEPATEFYDYDAKYFREDTLYHCPSGLPDSTEQMLRGLALRAFQILGGSGWGRIDFLMDKNGKPYLLEANTVPGLTSHSLVPMAAKVEGLSYADLCLAILDTAHVG